VEVLLRAHANVSAQSDQGETPLMEAVANNHSVVAERLLSWVGSWCRSSCQPFVVLPMPFFML